jgi:spore coat protein H
MKGFDMTRTSWLMLVILFFGAFSGLFAQDPGDSVFAGIQIHTVNIHFLQSTYWDSLTIYYDAGLEQYIPATVIIGTDTLDSVGVRFKGHSSMTHPNNKKPFRLSIDEYLSDQRWDGLKGVHLNNAWGDPSFMREKLHLDFCNDAGIPAPRGNFARLYLNDTLWGLYSLVEHVDKTLLKTRFGNKNGDLFKAIDAFDTSSVLSDFRWWGSAESTYYPLYEMKTDESTTAWPNLLELLDTLNNNPSLVTALPKMINLTTLYRAIAADNLFGNLDSYIGSGRNFYAYFLPTTEKMEWIKWDMGLSFGAYGGGVSNIDELNVTYIKSATDLPLMGKVFTTPVLRNKYLRALYTLYKDYFISTSMFAHIDSIANIIRPYVSEDTRKMYTTQQFETNITSEVNAPGGAITRIPGLKPFIAARETNVLSQLTALGITNELPVSVGDIVINEFMAQNSVILDPAGEADDWIELYNATADTMDLGGMFLSDDSAEPTKWQFPAGTLIEPTGYLIVWADEDLAQVGVHADFKLSAGGEQIFLSNTDSTVLDSVTFGAQMTDISMARIPNGTGSFVTSTATFCANNDGANDVSDEDVQLPTICRLLQNYPNPFNPGTTISFTLPQNQLVQLEVFNLLGMRIATLVNGRLSAGSHTVTFDASKLSTGLYFYRMISGTFQQTKRMMLIKLGHTA